MIIEDTSHSEIPPADVCVVGAGPVGIAVALECEKHGLRVTVLESGRTKTSPDSQLLSAFEISDRARHAPSDIAQWRGLGGTSERWGGRCVPLGEIDFRKRSHVPDSGWPIAHAELNSYYDIAASLLDCGKAIFTAPTSLDDLSGDVSVTDLERWSRQPRIRMVHMDRLRRSGRLRVHLGCTVVRLAIAESGNVSGAVVRSGERCLELKARIFILAASGVENTRLLLNTRAEHPGSFGGEDGVLGRFYMGHVAGSIARIEIENPVLASSLRFFQDSEHVFVRRRFTLAPAILDKLNLLNIALWLDNRPLEDHWHRSGALSAAHLGIFLPASRILGISTTFVSGKTGSIRGHVRNIVSAPGETIRGLADLAEQLIVTRRRLPHFFHQNPKRRYSLRYSSEQIPNRESAITLSDTRDAFGVRRARVDLRFSDQDFRSVIRAHEALDYWLRQNKLGWIDFPSGGEERMASVSEQACDGYHQIGATRMSADSRSGVVDTDCRVHGTRNLYVAGSSVFPTAGHANPTLTAVALAARLAKHIQSRHVVAAVP